MGMKKKEILKNINVNKVGNTIFIQNREVDFCYTPANDVVKDEYKDQYRYFGGMQCNYPQDSQEYKTLEKYLCDIAEFILNY